MDLLTLPDRTQAGADLIQYWIPEPCVEFLVSLSPYIPLTVCGAVARATCDLVGPISALQCWMASGWARIIGEIGPLHI